VSFCAAGSAFAANATSCGTAGYFATITSVNVTPTNPVKGQPVALPSAGTISAAVANGVSSLVVKLDGVSVAMVFGCSANGWEVRLGLCCCNNAVLLLSCLPASSLPQVQLFTHAGTTCGNTQISFPLGFGSATLDGLSCPVAAGGAIAPGMTLTLPSAAPSGTYEVTIDAKDNSSNEVYCLQVTFVL
jgi:hypothetical protein